jgi:hypothetical protein
VQFKIIPQRLNRLRKNSEHGVGPAENFPPGLKAGADFEPFVARLNSLAKKSLPQVEEKIRG